MLDAACAWKLSALAFSALAAGLRAGDFEFAALLAHVGGSAADAGEALRKPRDVLRKAVQRGARQIEQSHRAWLDGEFANTAARRTEAQQTIEALPFVLRTSLPDPLAVADKAMNVTQIAGLVVQTAGRSDERFREGTLGERLLRQLLADAFATAEGDAEFRSEMGFAIDRAVNERTIRLEEFARSAVEADSRQEAALGRIEAAVEAGAARLHLLARQRLKEPPRNLRELLLADLRATDLVGREEELQPLKSWLAMAQERRDVSVHCLTGEGGAGKTRLAIELCEWAEQAGWAAGFASQDEFARFNQRHHPSEWRWRQSTLVVVDYAAASAQVLRAWLDALARGEAGAQEAPLRILLLERHADREAGWWAELARSGGIGGRGADSLIDDAAPLKLGPLRSVAHRRALLDQAMQLAAPFLGRTAVPLPQPGMDSLFDQRLASASIETEPLFLIMAGIVAVDTGAPAALALRRRELAEQVAESECRRLEHVADGAKVDCSLFLHLAACVTLQNGCNAEQANTLVQEECDALGERSAPRPDRLVALLSNALAPADGAGVDAVRPDLIGEAFLLAELARERSPRARQAAIVERAFGRVGLPVITMVTRVAQDFAEGRGDHISVAWLEHLASLTDDPFALAAIANELPQRTLALRERATEITRRVVNGFRIRAAADPDLRPMLAAWCNDLGIRLSEVGDREGALMAARESGELYRALATQRPDAFRPYLAGSLSNLAAMLSEVGDREGALAAAREAVDLRREPAVQRPNAFRPDLAMSLNNLAVMLGAVGDREAALGAAREAVDLRRALAALQPDAFRPDLAMSLNNLASRLSAGGNREAALAAAREAGELYRALAAQRPDAFRPDLAGSLNNLAIRLSEVTDREGALAAAREAVDLRRALAAQRPDAFRPDLARSLLVLGYCLEAAERLDEALAADVEAVRTLAPAFTRLPQAFAPLMQAVLHDYLRRCEAQKAEPDGAMLAPIVETLQGLQNRQQPHD